MIDINSYLGVDLGHDYEVEELEEQSKAVGHRLCLPNFDILMDLEGFSYGDTQLQIINTSKSSKFSDFLNRTFNKINNEISGTNIFKVARLSTCSITFGGNIDIHQDNFEIGEVYAIANDNKDISALILVLAYPIFVHKIEEWDQYIHSTINHVLNSIRINILKESKVSFVTIFSTMKSSFQDENSFFTNVNPVSFNSTTAKVINDLQKDSLDIRYAGIIKNSVPLSCKEFIPSFDNNTVLSGSAAIFLSNSGSILYDAFVSQNFNIFSITSLNCHDNHFSWLQLIVYSTFTGIKGILQDDLKALLDIARNSFNSNSINEESLTYTV